MLMLTEMGLWRGITPIRCDDPSTMFFFLLLSLSDKQETKDFVCHTHIRGHGNGVQMGMVLSY